MSDRLALIEETGEEPLAVAEAQGRPQRFPGTLALIQRRLDEATHAIKKSLDGVGAVYWPGGGT
jgi:hypothetical protein